MEIELNFELESYFKIEVKKNNGDIRSTGWIKNLILDQGLTFLRGTGVSPWDFCYVGSSSAPPSTTQTTLVSQIAQSASGSGGVSSANVDGGYYEITMQYNFAEGVAAGNISEIGCGRNGGLLYARALIKDSGGNPTTITVLPDESLIVTWAHRRYWPTTDASGSIINTGNRGGTYSWVSRAAEVASWTIAAPGSATLAGIGFSTSGNTFFTGNTLGLITGKPSGVESASGVQSFVISSPDGQAMASGRLDFSSGPRTIGAILFGFRGMRYQMSFTPQIQMTEDDVMSISVSMSWSRRP
jgi:hypothetical protein